jgi:hypothetical protein
MRINGRELEGREIYERLVRSLNLELRRGPPKPKAVPNGTRALNAATDRWLERLRELSRSWQESGKRRAVYDYLEQAYLMVNFYRGKWQLEYLENRLTNVSGVRKRKNGRLFSALIQATSPPMDKRKRSKLTQVLTIHFHRDSLGLEYVKLGDAVRESGGINAYLDKNPAFRKKPLQDAGKVPRSDERNADAEWGDED